MTSQTLADILSSIVGRQYKNSKTLERGLILAYTPGEFNQTERGVYRLTLSRLGTWPSDKEIVIVKSALRDALRRNERIPDQVIVEMNLKGNGHIYYHVIAWRELVQANLFQ